MPEQLGHETWLYVWMDALRRQYERIQAIKATKDFSDVQAEAMLYAVALGATVLNAEAILTGGHHTVAAFNRRCPNAKHVRDIASHLDAYAKGTGCLQVDGRVKPGAVSYLKRNVGTGKVTMVLYGHDLDGDDTYQCARDMYRAVGGK